jgi:hypothetical protein
VSTESTESPYFGPIPADEDNSALRPGIMAILFLSLPLFGQIFHYMKDLLPLWSLSKAFPILSLPLALVVFRNPGVPMTRQVLVSFLWLTLVPSFAGIFSFNQDFFTGLAAQVKLLPMLYFFSFFGLLLLLRPSLRELTSGFVTCGVITFIVLVVLWAVVPQSSYGSHYAFGSSPLFTSDNRGNRIRMPMFFAIIAIFYFYRRFLRSPRLAPLVWSLIGVGLTMGLVKTRAMLVGIAGVMLINGFLASRSWLRIAMMVAAPLAVTAMFSFSYLGSVFSTDAGSGFDVRWQTILKATSFLGVNPIRWILGVGTISPTSTDSLSAYFDHFFFLADITWLGVVFEFGLVGALLFVAYELRGIAFYQRSLRPRIDSDFLGSLSDYLIYVLLISNLYPPTLTPGETAVILAIFAYVWQWLQTQDQQPEEF